MLTSAGEMRALVILCRTVLLFLLGEVWLSQMAVTQPEHMEGTWKVWLLVLESHSGVSPVWGSVLTD